MLHPNDIPGFFANKSQLDLEKYILVDILFETTLEPRLAAATLCCEQSTAQWKRPGSQEDLRSIHGAKVVCLEIIDQQKKPFYEFPWISGDQFFLCRAQIAHPHINFGPKIPNLLSAIAGEGPFYCPGLTTLKICDIHFPNSFLSHFEGPQFGIEGLRKILKVEHRPFFIGVVKPNLGLSSADFASRAYEAWMGGLDIAKDDEMLADASWSSVKERMELAFKMRRRAEEETGVPKMMIANITDEVDQLSTLYKQALAGGANAVMLNSFHAGFSALRSLRKKSNVPLMSHFTGMALFERMPYFGIEGAVLVKLQRLAGADLMGLPGFGSRMQTTDLQVLCNIRACLEPMGSILPSLPIPGGSDRAGTLESVYQKIGHVDFGFIAGRGIFNHPDGPKAGAQSLRLAWPQKT